MPPAQPRFTPQRSVASGDEAEGSLSDASSPSSAPDAAPRGSIPAGVIRDQPAASWTGAAARRPADPTRWGWTAHQSHGQATLLFLVPREVNEDDLDVRIGPDYVVAGLRGAEPTIRARLSGRVNPVTSTWTLEKRKRRSGSHKDTSGLRRSRAHRSEAGDGTSKAVREAASSTSLRSRPDSPASSAASSYDMVPPDAMAASYPSISDLGRDASPTAHSRSPRSPSSPRSFHSPQRHLAPDSSPSLASSPLSQSIVLSTGSGESQSSGSHVSYGSRSRGEADLASSGTLSSRRADEDDVDADGRRSARLVTIHLDKVDAGVWGCFVSGAPPIEMTVPRASGAGLGVTSPGSQSLTDALSEALRTARAAQASDASASEGEDDGEAGDESTGVHQSTATVDTIGSDDSNTVLGARPILELSMALEQGEAQAGQSSSLSASRRRPSRVPSGTFQLDPTSLTLLGMKHANAAAVQPWKAAEEADLAFKFFAHAFRNGEVPQAIERLVEGYLPLDEVMSDRRDEMPASSDPASGATTALSMALSASNDTCQGRPSVETVRPRASTATASDPRAPVRTDSRHARRLRVLGGNKELARLYVCYARLSLPSFESQLSPLSFPSSGSTNPYAAASRASSVASAASSSGKRATRTNSPGAAEREEGRSQAREEMSMAKLMVLNGPLVYLNAARTLDPDVFIDADEISEASLIAHNASLELAAEEAADDAEEDAEGLPYYSSARSESSEPHLGDARDRRKRGGAGKGRRSGRRHKGGSRMGKSKAGLGHDAGLIPMALVSGAALVGFAVAGAVAVGQIWRRAAGTQAV